MQCTDNNTCLNCEVKYYLDGGNCSPCQGGCFDCDNMTNCSSCISSYYFNPADNDCLLCSDNLIGCQFCDDADTCTNCLNGYYLNTNQCLACQDVLSGCSICEDNATCVLCNSGYYLSIVDDQCQLCATMIGCQLCTD